eukprot:1406235-Rhodomonas_salina.1
MNINTTTPLPLRSSFWYYSVHELELLKPDSERAGLRVGFHRVSAAAPVDDHDKKSLSCRGTST